VRPGAALQLCAPLPKTLFYGTCKQTMAEATGQGLPNSAEAELTSEH
jgi:hypothetical protein